MTFGVVQPVTNNHFSAIDEEKIELLLSEKLMKGYGLLEASCPECRTPLLKKRSLKESDRMFENLVVPPVVLPKGSFKKQFKPVEGVPYCVGCTSHVITNEYEISVLERCDALKNKGSLLVASKESFGEKVTSKYTPVSDLREVIDLGGYEEEKKNKESMVGSVEGEKEEDSRIEYSIRRGIATKVLGVKMMQGYTLQETQCGKCEMPMMAYKGKVNCVVCPALDKAEKKKVTGLADKRRHKKETQDQLDELRRTEVAEEEEAMNKAEEAEMAVVEAFFTAQRELIAETIAIADADAVQEAENIIRAEREDYRDDRESNSEADLKQLRETGIILSSQQPLEFVEKPPTLALTVQQLEDNFETKKDVASKEISKRMIQGWKLMDASCPTCVMPLMIDNAGQKDICVLCGSVENDHTSLAATIRQQATMNGGNSYSASRNDPPPSLDRNQVSAPTEIYLTNQDDVSRMTCHIPLEVYHSLEDRAGEAFDFSNIEELRNTMNIGNHRIKPGVSRPSYRSTLTPRNDGFVVTRGPSDFVRDSIDDASGRAGSLSSQTLDSILSRIEDCKEKLMDPNIDGEAQAETANLIEKLAQAAVAVRKLEELEM